MLMQSSIKYNVLHELQNNSLQEIIDEMMVDVMIGGGNIFEGRLKHNWNQMGRKQQLMTQIYFNFYEPQQQISNIFILFKYRKSEKGT